MPLRSTPWCPNFTPRLQADATACVGLPKNGHDEFEAARPCSSSLRAPPKVWRTLAPLKYFRHTQTFRRAITTPRDIPALPDEIALRILQLAEPRADQLLTLIGLSEGQRHPQDVCLFSRVAWDNSLWTTLGLSDANARPGQYARQVVSHWQRMTPAEHFFYLRAAAEPTWFDERDFFLAYPAFDATFLIVLAAAMRNGDSFRFASATMRADRDIVSAVIGHYGFAFAYAHPRFWSDRDLVLRAALGGGPVFRYVSPHFQRDRPIALAVLAHAPLSFDVWETPDLLDYADAHFGERDFAMAEVKGRHIAVADDLHVSFRRDPQFLIEACAWNVEVLQFADAALLSHFDFVRQVVAVDGRALQYASESLQGDASIALAALESSFLAILYVAPHLRDDETIVAAAVKADGRNLQYASSRLQQDCALVLLAVQNAPRAWRFAQGAARLNREVVHAVATSLSSPANASSTDAQAAAGQDFFFAITALAAFADDRDIVLAVLRHDGSMLREVKADFRADKAMVMAATGEHAGALRYASAALRSDPQIIVNTLRAPHGPLDIDEITSLLRKDVLTRNKLIEQMPGRLLALGKPYVGMRAMALRAVRTDGFFLQDLSKALQSDRQIVLAAVRKSPFALRYASRAMQKNALVCAYAGQIPCAMNQNDDTDSHSSVSAWPLPAWIQRLRAAYG